MARSARSGRGFCLLMLDLDELKAINDQAGHPAGVTASVADAPPPGAVVLVERSLNGGFAGGPDGLVFVTDRELFGNVRVRRPKAMRRVVPRDILERLTPGDLVVHIDHGVARYERMLRRSAGEGDEREALGALIGRKGERLSALQHLVNLMLSKEMGGWTRVLVDVEDYRGRRERQLREIAERAARRVIETGKMLQLEPIPALERRWVHLALRDHPDVVTQSIGEEPNRRIVVLPRPS